MRRVARALVRDAHLAEDLAQDAWLAALRRGRSSGPDRAWRSGVLRNLRSNAARKDLRRTDLEARSHEDVDALATDEIAEQLQLRERIAHELGRLDEPLRRAVYLRFVEGLSLRATARRLDVATSTASARVDRGLERLRARLDGAHGGNRRVWVTLLAPAVRRAGLPALTPSLVLVMGSTLLAAIAAIVFVPGLLRPPSPDLTPPDTADLAALAAAGPEAKAPPTPGVTSENDPSIPRSQPSGASQALAPPLTSAASTDANEEVHIVGRLLLPDGRGAAGTDWTFSGRQSRRRASSDGGVAEWEDLTGRLGPDGTFDIHFVPDPAFHYALVLDHPDHVPVHVRWAQLEEDTTRDLGDIALERPGRIEGTVTDGSGQPLPLRPWRVMATKLESVGIEAPSTRGASGVADTTGARFAIERLPAGPLRLKVYDRQLGWVDGPIVEVVAGETVQADMPLPEAAAFQDAVVVTFSIRRGTGFQDPGPEHVALVSEGGLRQVGSVLTDRASGMIFEDVGPGDFTVEVTDPRYQHWTSNPVQAGASVWARLRGNASLDLVVQDSSGAAVEQFKVKLEYGSALASPEIFEEIVDRSGPGGGVLRELLPGRYRLEVRAGDAAAYLDPFELEPGETKSLPVQLHEVRHVTGVVLNSDGDPLPRALVRAALPAAIDDSPSSGVLDGQLRMSDPSRGRQLLSETRTADDGSFSLSFVAGERLVVIAGEPGTPQAEQILDVTTDAQLAPVALQLTRGARLEGRIELPSGAQVTRWGVHFIPGDPAVAVDRPTRPALVRRDGSFTLEGLPAGGGQLFLRQNPIPRPGVANAVGGGAVHPHVRALGTLVLKEGETISRDFAYPGPVTLPVSFEIEGLESSDRGSGIQIALSPEGAGLSAELASSDATLGPATLEPGRFSGVVSGEGFLAVFEALTITESDAGSTRTIPLELSTRTIRLMHGGEPVASTPIAFIGTPDGSSFERLETDAEGRVELRLGRGIHEIHVRAIDADPELLFKLATLDWPLGAGITDVEFE